MTDLTTSINLARDARVFVSSEPNPDPCLHNNRNTYEVNVLSDYSFSQDSNSETISLNESGCAATRGSKTFNTDLAAVDLSITTYIRPYINSDEAVRSIEEFLINGMISQYEEVIYTKDKTVNPRGDDGNPAGAIRPMAQEDDKGNVKGILPEGGRADGTDRPPHTTPGTNVRGVVERQVIDLSKSNVGELLKLHFYFKLGSVAYLVKDVQMESMGIDFAIDAIATMSFSGLGTIIEQLDIEKVDAWTGGINYQPVASMKAPKDGDPEKPKEAYYLNNKLSDVRILAKSGAFKGTYYNIPITGGSITWTNNISFLVPEELSRVSKPVFGSTGSREITGELTAYLRSEDVAGTKDEPMFSGNLLGHLANDAEAVSNSYAMVISIAGCGNRTPRLDLVFPQASLTVPTIVTEDVISTSISFTAQGSTMTTADEMEFHYVLKEDSNREPETVPATELPVTTADLVGPIPIDVITTASLIKVYFDKDLASTLPPLDTFCVIGGGSLVGPITISGKVLSIVTSTTSAATVLSYFGKPGQLTGDTTPPISVDPFTVRGDYDTDTPVFTGTIANILGRNGVNITGSPIDVSTQFSSDATQEKPTAYRLFGAPSWLKISNSGMITGQGATGVSTGVYVIGSIGTAQAKSNTFSVTITAT